MLTRRTLVFIAATLTACAAPFKPLEFAPPVALQDAPPGLAIVYLLRVPHDGQAIDVYFGGKKAAALPPARYTAVTVAPGTYSIVAVNKGDTPIAGTSTNASVLTVAAGERRFLYTSVPTRSSESILFAPLRGGMVPLFVPLRAAIGARTWRECGEADAQGLLSISKVVAPEPNAL